MKGNICDSSDANKLGEQSASSPAHDSFNPLRWLRARGNALQGLPLTALTLPSLASVAAAASATPKSDTSVSWENLALSSQRRVQPLEILALGTSPRTHLVDNQRMIQQIRIEAIAHEVNNLAPENRRDVVNVLVRVAALGNQNVSNVEKQKAIDEIKANCADISKIPLASFDEICGVSRDAAARNAKLRYDMDRETAKWFNRIGIIVGGVGVYALNPVAIGLAAGAFAFASSLVDPADLPTFDPATTQVAYDLLIRDSVSLIGDGLTDGSLEMSSLLNTTPALKTILHLDFDRSPDAAVDEAMPELDQDQRQRLTSLVSRASNGQLTLLDVQGEFKSMQTEWSASIDSTLHMVREEEAARRDQRESEAVNSLRLERFLSEARGASKILSFLAVNVFDNQQAAAAIIQGTEAVSLIAKSLDNYGDAPGQIGVLALTGNYLQALNMIIGIFGIGGPSPDQMLMDAISRLGAQLNDFRKEMNARLDVLEKNQKTIINQLNELTDIVIEGLNHLGEISKNTQDRVISVQRQIGVLTQKIDQDNFLDAVGKLTFLMNDKVVLKDPDQSRVVLLGYLSTVGQFATIGSSNPSINGAPLPQEPLVDPEKFRERVMERASIEAAFGLLPEMMAQCDTATFLTPHPAFLSNGHNLPNPVAWAMAAQVYLETLAVFPDLYRSNPVVQMTFENIVKRGEEINRAVEELNLRRSLQDLRSDYLIAWNKLLVMMKTDLEEREKTYRAKCSWFPGFVVGPYAQSAKFDLANLKHFNDPYDVPEGMVWLRADNPVIIRSKLPSEHDEFVTLIQNPIELALAIGLVSEIGPTRMPTEHNTGWPDPMFWRLRGQRHGPFEDQDSKTTQYQFNKGIPDGAVITLGDEKTASGWVKAKYVYTNGPEKSVEYFFGGSSPNSHPEVKDTADFINFVQDTLEKYWPTFVKDEIQKAADTWRGVPKFQAAFEELERASIAYQLGVAVTGWKNGAIPPDYSGLVLTASDRTLPTTGGFVRKTLTEIALEGTQKRFEVTTPVIEVLQARLDPLVNNNVDALRARVLGPEQQRVDAALRAAAGPDGACKLYDDLPNDDPTLATYGFHGLPEVNAILVQAKVLRSYLDGQL